MFRPSRPMIRPFMSSLGSSTIETGRLGGVARGDALEGVGDEVPRAALRLGPRLLLELPDAPRELVADELLRALEQVPLRSAGVIPATRSSSFSSFSFARFSSSWSSFEVRLAVVDALLAPRELGRASARAPVLERRDALLGLGDLGASVAHLLLDLGAERQLALARLDLRLAADRVGLPLGLVDQERPAAAASPEPALLQRHDRVTAATAPTTIPIAMPATTSMLASSGSIDAPTRPVAARLLEFADAGAAASAGWPRRRPCLVRSLARWFVELVVVVGDLGVGDSEKALMQGKCLW